MSFFTAFEFLTVFPLPWKRQLGAAELAHSVTYFPLIGLLIGLILAGLNWLFKLVLPPDIVSVFIIVALVLITGALHLDGFLDTCDGVAGHRTVEERWEIMRDSRAGAFGVIGVVLLLLVKYVVLSSVPPILMMPVLVFLPVVSRWAMVYAIFAYPYARPSGLGKVFKDGVTWRGFTVATLTTVIIAVVLFPLFSIVGLVAVPAVWLMTLVLAAYLRSKLGGLTGDTYGAINETAEVFYLVLVVLLLNLASPGG